MAGRDHRPPILVAGGVYRERCLKPHANEVYGSGGRAATAMACMGVPVELHSYLDERTREVMSANAALNQFALRPTAIDRSLAFYYIHGLETPRIYGLGPPAKPLSLRGERVLRFGMLEGDAVVEADRAVYDPQNVGAPVHFQVNGSKAAELALVLNRAEARALAQLPNALAPDLARALIDQKAADVVVIKQGPLGALVDNGKSIELIPAYRSNHVWKIGSGDTFVAHFARAWLHEEKSAGESADIASRATAYYCDTQGYPSREELAEFRPTPIVPSERLRQGYRPRLYLAGPFFTLAELWLIEQARESFTHMGLEVFSPYHDVGHGSADDVVSLDLKAIEACDLLFAVGDGMDPGTVYEVGYARAKGKPVIVYSENEPAGDKKMMQGSECLLSDDFVSAVYQTLWVACTL